ncbi:MAG: hypothetical protein KatS3mg096_589 [Candidatus Parcubacteria bacterium]|nr:MAG: hypothetical protein KatS3mg096_589 [Candidatus Parcubacteria bacterium]
MVINYLNSDDKKHLDISNEGNPSLNINSSKALTDIKNYLDKLFNDNLYQSETYTGNDEDILKNENNEEEKDKIEVNKIFYIIGIASVSLLLISLISVLFKSE